MLNSPSHDVVSSHDAVKSECKGKNFFCIIKLAFEISITIKNLCRFLFRYCLNLQTVSLQKRRRGVELLAE